MDKRLILMAQCLTLMTSFFQVLEGNSRFFGYSIAGNMDLDRNSYPDVAVGSLSDSVTIFRCVIPDFG